MRKLNNPMPSGGAPFTNEDLNDVFQTEVWAAMQVLLSGYDSDAEGVIVSGCVVTPNASNFDMTAGIVYLNGEFMRVDAVTNQTFPKYIKAATVNNVARIFGDAASKTMIVEKKAQVSATVDGSGQEITISSVATAGARRFFTSSSTKQGLLKLYTDMAASNTDGAVSQNALRTQNFNTTGTGEFDGGLRTGNTGVFLKRKVIDIGDWNMDTTSSINVAHGLSDYKKVRAVSIIIRNDSDTDLYPIDSISAGGVVSGSWGVGSSTNINITRSDLGRFDNAAYSATSYNRGWITIDFEA